MKNGQVPMHFMRWSPSEYLDDPFVRRLYLARNYRCIAFYTAFLFRSHINGGFLPVSDRDRPSTVRDHLATVHHPLATVGEEPSTVDHLSATVRDLSATVLLPPSTVDQCLRVCVDAGKVVIENGRLFHKRVLAEVEEFEALRRASSVAGKRGAQARIDKEKARVPQAPPKLETGGDGTGGEETGRGETGGDGAPSPPAARPPTRQGAPGELEIAQADAKRELTDTSRAVGIGLDELLALDSRTPNGKSILSVDGCDSVAWLRVLSNKLRERRHRFEAEQRAPPLPPTGRTASDRTKAAVDRILAEEEQRARSRDVHEGVAVDRGSAGPGDDRGALQRVLPGAGRGK